MTHDTDDTAPYLEGAVGPEAQGTAPDTGAGNARATPAGYPAPIDLNYIAAGPCVEAAEAEPPTGVIGVMRHAEVEERAQAGGGFG